jgi:uncharacterized membrane protein
MPSRSLRAEPARVVRTAPVPAAEPQPSPPPLPPRAGSPAACRPRRRGARPRRPRKPEADAGAPVRTARRGPAADLDRRHRARRLAGLFLVRYSIQIGLITPAVRMLMAAGVRPAADRCRRGRAAPRRLRHRPAGRAGSGRSGVLVLYAAAYGAHVLYGPGQPARRVRPDGRVTVACLGLVAAAHGAPAAVMGLVGGFLTPVLVGQGSEPRCRCSPTLPSSTLPCSRLPRGAAGPGLRQARWR